MHTPGASAGNTPPAGARLHRRRLTHPGLLHAAPVLVIGVYGALWIALHAGGGRTAAHTLWQSLALAETVLALFLRQRKPVGALAAILATYLLFALDPLLLPGMLLSLLSVATIRGHRTVAIAATATGTVIAAMPYGHGDAASFSTYSLPRMAAAAVAVAWGMYQRKAQTRAEDQPWTLRQQGGQQGSRAHHGPGPNGQ